MMHTITLVGRDGRRAAVEYCAATSSLRWVGGGDVSLHAVESVTMPPREPYARRIKVRLGMACNYRCTYCSQAEGREVSRHRSAGSVSEFLSQIAGWIGPAPEDEIRVEMWGGEPLLYWPRLRELWLAVWDMYPTARLSLVTNGSLMTDEIAEELVRLGASVTLSHDGPGQHLRGADVLDIAHPAAGPLMRLYDRLAPDGRMMISSVVTPEHHDLVALRDWFAGRLGGRALALNIEGFVYPRPGNKVAPLAPDEQRKIIFALMGDILAMDVWTYRSIGARLADFFGSLRDVRPASRLGQKCGMDRDDTIAVDLRGDVWTCQDFATPDQHRGHIGAPLMPRGTSWRDRPDCPTCPVLQICQGSCMALDADMFRAACAHDWIFSAAIFFAGIAFITDMLPEVIDGPIPRPARGDVA